MVYMCDMCDFEANVFSEFRYHYIRRHQHDPNFHVRCCIGACAYTSKKWSSFKVHMHRRHKQVVENERQFNEHEEIYHEIPDHDDYGNVGISYQNTMYTLSLESRHKLSQVACDNIISSTSELLTKHDSFLRHSIKDELLRRGIDSSFVDQIPVDTSFQNLRSASEREKTYHTLPAYVKPLKVVLRSVFKRKKGKIVEVSKSGHIVPFEKSLSMLISMPEVWESVVQPKMSEDDIMRDIVDGDMVRNQPLFRENPANTLLISINCDDLEFVNPIGSHTKIHKVTVFYYSLLNIPCQYRSSLHSIQLLAIGKTKDVKGREGILLNDFIKTIQTLSSTGLDVIVNNAHHNVKGLLVMVTADTPASNCLGQFKEGVSFALKNCRMCNLDGRFMDTIYTARDPSVSLRTMQEHRERCEVLASPFLTKKAKQYWSTQWGINGSSCLLQIDGFPLTTALVQDPMHVLLEGLVKNELSLVLSSFIYVEKMFTLKWFNEAIIAFPYSYLHSNRKPVTFEKKHLDGTGTIRQTASAMLTLCEVLPIIIGQKVPEANEVWINWLRLIQIVLLCTTPYCSRSTASILQIFICKYLHTFRNIHSRATFTPKMHFMIHLPQQMLLYGPLRHTWCMRYEGKNGFLKSKKYQNFKNIPACAARDHQKYMCLKMSGDYGGLSRNFLYEGDSIKEGETIDMHVTYPELTAIMDRYADQAVTEVYSTPSASIHGREFRQECVLLLDYEDSEPKFGLVRDILVHDADKYFIIEETASHFEEHTIFYQVEPSGNIILRSFYDLKYPWPLSLYKYGDKSVVMNTCGHTCQLF